jgi:DNA primase
LRATFRSGDELLRHGIAVLVTTLPPGEDPDSLVRKGGAAKLSECLRDSLDIMERKLHVLQQHGWLADLARRRSALDKLLPTITAASDPFTRDMYISMVSEKVGVSRETIQTELEYSSAFASSHERSSSSEKGTQSNERKLGNYCRNDERNLLYILVTYPVWRERARDEVSIELLHDEGYRELYGELLSGTEADGQLFESRRLSARAQLALRIVQNSEAFAGINVDLTYVGACESLEARRLVERLKDRKKLIKPETDPKVQDEAWSSIWQLRVELAEKYPKPWVRHCARDGFLRRLQSAKSVEDARTPRDDQSRQRHVS